MRVEAHALFIRFDLKLFVLRFIIKLEPIVSKKSGGPVDELRILNAKVLGSIPGVCLFLRLQILVYAVPYGTGNSLLYMVTIICEWRA